MTMVNSSLKELRFGDMCSQIKTNMSNFQPLEVVDRGSETQLQVVENLNKST